MQRRYPPIPGSDLTAFLKIVRRLRRECPWDREQTHESLRHSLIEEAYEVIQALDENNLEELCKELGDLLLHVAMHATIAEQAGEFTLRDVVRGITDKLVRRHPHIFGTTAVGSATEVKQNWEKLKMNEGRTSVLEGIPTGMPALQRALRVQQRAAMVGFDWRKKEEVWKKVREELEEFRSTSGKGRTKRREEEFGDLLFSLVNYARFLDINPENALRATIKKFLRRFHQIEEELRKRGKSIHDSRLEEMDDIWNSVKRKKR